MNITKHIKNILSAIYLSTRRFPVTIILSTALAILLITIQELETKTGGVYNTDTLSKIAMAIAIGMALSLCIKMILEKEESNKRAIIYHAIGAIFVLAYYFMFIKDFKMVTMSRFFATNLMFYIAFVFIPYWPKRQNFEMYVVKIFASFFTTVLYSGVLYLGLAAILFTIDQLLGVNIKSQIYYYTFLLVALVFAPTYFLANVPLKHEEFTKENFIKLFKVLILYIVMPLLSAYTTILYIYFFKILITRVFPQGIVSHLVLWYSIIVTAVLFFITPIIEENKWARIFLKVIPKVILPILVMMFVSIGIRINQYGITENRYYVLVMGIWVFLIMIYFAFTRKLINIVIPTTLALVILISTFGPLSSFSISKYSQNKRFESILVKNQMLKDGKVVPNANISKEDKLQISMILEYFERNHSLKDVKHLPDNFEIKDMKTVFGFESQSGYIYPIEYYTIERDPNYRSLDIKDYDYFLDTRYMLDNATYNGLAVKYDYDTAVVRILDKGKEIYSKDLDLVVKQIIEKNKDVITNKHTLSPDEMSFVDENQFIKVKIQFNFISIGKTDLEQGLDTNRGGKGYEFYVFVTIK
ncbi:hypothetical protein ABG79_01870 [Caloramator mitchellensis]|uniref:DUF4153 domain-containing protein n=1 Tax=Caloramator mitchellensis TaxID=908809 RepID=A0A0R3JS76_CALMK|nr:DUF4153 domain-containing protein [Caloramator mitchellensis]KRQ86358.1 hypothetical protein ABG79_01870 [Caloramator mitchellensis]